MEENAKKLVSLAPKFASICLNILGLKGNGCSRPDDSTRLFRFVLEVL